MADVTIAIIGKDEASAAIKSVNTSLGGLDTSAVNAAKSMAGIAAVGIGAAGAGIAAGLVAATKSAADFESQVSGIAAVAGPEGVAALDQIREKALQVGTDTSFSATEAAAGMEELIKAGVSIQDVLGPATDATVALAAATGVDLSVAAEVASNAMNQFGLAGEDMGRIADVVAGAANASAIDVNDFKYSMAAAGAVVDMVGLSFEDGAVAIAQLGAAGLKGSDAGTSLKSMLMNLIPSTNAQRDEFRRLGLETTNLEAGLSALRAKGIEPAGDDWGSLNKAALEYLGISKPIADLTKKEADQLEELHRQTGAISNAFFDASGKAKGFADIQGVLSDTYKDMTEQQKLASQEILFGSDGIRAATILTEGGAEAYNKMSESMGKVSAADVAATRLDNLNGSIDALMGSVEVLSITIGTALLPIVRQVVDGANELIQANMPLIKQFASELPGAVASFAAVVVPVIAAVFGWLIEHGPTIMPILAGIAAGFVFFAGVVAPIMAVASAIGGLISTLSAAGAALSTAGSVIGAVVALLGGPVTLAIVALVAAVGLLTAAWVGNWGDIQGKTAAVVEFLSTVPGTVGGFFDAVGTKLNELSTGATATLDAMAAGIGAAVEAVGEFFNQMGTSAHALVVTVSAAWTNMSNFIAAVLTLIGTTISAAWNLYIDLTMLPLRLLYEGVMAVWNALPVDIREDLELIGRTLVERFADFVLSAIKWVDETDTLVDNGWATITSTITDALNGIAKSIETWIADTLKAFGGWAAEVGNQATLAVKNLTDPITKAFADLLEQLGGWAADTIEALGRLVADVKDKANSIGAAIFTPITDKLNETLGAVTTWAGGIIEALGRLVTDATNKAGEIGQGIIDGIINTIKGATDALGDALGGVVRGALDGVKDALGLDDDTGEVTSIGRSLIDEIIIGAKAKAGDLSGALGDILKDATAGLMPGAGTPVNLPGDVTDWLNQAMSIAGVPSSWLQGLLQLVQIESGGDPNAMNPAAVVVDGVNYGHATGLLQTIPPTFAAYALPGHENILNPVDNAIAAIRYIEATYGDVYEALRRHGGVGYATGGMIPEEVWGVGRSGQVYGFGENGPEYVVPVSRSWSEVGTPSDSGSNSRRSIGHYRDRRTDVQPASWSEADMTVLGRTIAAAIGQPVVVNGYSSNDILRQMERQRRRERLLYPQAGWSA